MPIDEGKRRESGPWNLPLDGVTADKAGYSPGRRFLAVLPGTLLRRGAVKLMIVDF